MRALGGGDQHHLVAGQELRHQRARPPPRQLEARAALLARLHARRHVEDDQQPHALGGGRGDLEVGAHEAGDQREQEPELEREQQVGAEAPAVERLGRHALPEKERPDRHRAAAAAVEVEHDQHADGAQREGPGGVREPQRHRRPSTPSRGSSTDRNSRTLASVARRA